MRLQLIQTCAPAIVDYRNRSLDRHRMIGRLFRVLSGVLAVFFGSSAFFAWWSGWRVNFFCVAAASAAVAMGLRAWKPPRIILRRSAWALASVVCGLWTILFFSNQFHGQPPKSDTYLMGCWALSCSISILGQLFDTPD
ncbi:MAG TPA: hypothetical protein VFC78_23280 [Tepidisphaeraceae bacterium]|nr:hypothetical protein [Tepidisphaeraceae bacterium]